MLCKWMEASQPPELWPRCTGWSSYSRSVHVWISCCYFHLLGLQFTFSKAGYWGSFKSCQKCWPLFPVWGLSDFHQITAAFLNISYLIKDTQNRPSIQSETHTHIQKDMGKAHVYTHLYPANLSLRLWESPICGIGFSWMSLEKIGSLPICLGFNLSSWNFSICQKTRCDLSTSIL